MEFGTAVRSFADESTSIQQEMQLPVINNKMVEKLLMDLKASKSPGADGIHPRVLKELACELAEQPGVLV